MKEQAELESRWPKVAIIILNWNGWRDTIECLESVYHITYPNYNVILVDNGSEDGSFEKIKEYCDGKVEVKSEFFSYDLSNKPIKYDADKEKTVETVLMPCDKQITIIINKINCGFAEGNNIAMRYALKAFSPDYFLLLNNDTVVDPRFLGELIKVGESDKTIGIVGPTVYHYREQNRIQSAGVKLRWNTGRQNVFRSNEIDSGKFGEIIHVDYVAGCALLARAELIKTIGYLNSNYFAYWEETDWCIRAYNVGYKVLYTPKSKIWHKGSSTTQKLRGFHVYYMTRNMFWFMRQHATRQQYCLFLLYFFGIQFWLKCGIYSIYNRNIIVLVSFLRGVIDGQRTNAIDYI